MHSNNNKKNDPYGVLCGLRISALSDLGSESTRSSIPEPPPKDEIHSHPSKVAQNQPRPQSLTLPFENRERESHLVSDEEFDRIVRQAEFEIPVPSLPPGRTRNVSAAGLRRSISTARNTAFLRQRPVSLDVGSMTALSAAHSGAKGQPVPLSRESTLTAMPRPPTMNELAVYPGQRLPAKTPPPQISPSSIRKRHQRNATIANDHKDENRFREVFQQGHKRNRSAVQMVESVKKRLKRNLDSPTLSPEDSKSSPSKSSLHSPGRYPISDAASVQYQYGVPVSQIHNASDSSVFNDKPKPVKAVNTSPNDLKKSLLTRTWSRTKQHAKKLSISQPAINDSRPSISDPISLDVRPEKAQSTHTDISAAESIATSQYYASAEPSSLDTYESSRAGTPVSGELNKKYEFISGPAPRKNVLTRMGAPPRRSELNTVVARQQSRIMDLTLLNNVLVQQVENLRGEVEGMRVDSRRNRRVPGYDKSIVKDEGGTSGSDCGYPFNGHSNYDSEQENYGHVIGKRQSDSAASVWSSSVSARRRVSSGRVQRDPEGWRHIMGVTDEVTGGKTYIDEGCDKRKTWMTCDSEL